MVGVDVPGSAADGNAPRLRPRRDLSSSERVRRSCCEPDIIDRVSDGRLWYTVCGYTRRKKKPTKVSKKVPRARSSRNALVFPGKMSFPLMEKKKALRPKAARGNAVAVPRWCGQFSADVLTAAAKAIHPPAPTKNEHRHIRNTDPDEVS